jgi:hypothetical protein
MNQVLRSSPAALVIGVAILLAYFANTPQILKGNTARVLGGNAGCYDFVNGNCGTFRDGHSPNTCGGITAPDCETPDAQNVGHCLSIGLPNQCNNPTISCTNFSPGNCKGGQHF